MTKLAAQKQLTVTEPLDLRLLPDEGLRYDEELAVSWIDEQLAEFGTDATAVHAGSSGRVKLDVNPLAPVASRPPIRVHGELTAELAMTCVRCLQPLSQKIEADVDLTLFPEEKIGPEAGDDAKNDEDELGSAQLDEGTYSANELDIPGLVREALILEIAMHPRCEDESACSARTDALIKEANAASDGMVDDRWAALRRLRDQGKPS